MASAALLAGRARAGSTSVTLKHDYSPGSDTLTTEKVWKLDPDEPNPHRRRWVLERRLELKGLVIEKRKNGEYGASAQGVESEAHSYLRAEGPWFRAMSEFPCTQEPEEWFATREGARAAADAAAESWGEVLERERPKLALQLDRVLAESRAAATASADQVWREWVRSTTAAWRVHGESRARMAEWREYLKEAEELGVCGKGKAASRERTPAPVRWEAMMEPPPPYDPARFMKVLARAPARRWNGLFSVRTDIGVGKGSLDGKFLVDTGAGMTMLSPEFLDAQGVPAAWLELPRAPLTHVAWTGLRETGGGLARRAEIERASVSGLPLPLRDVLIFDTSFFGEPENLASCCDGILGTDMLRRFVVYFSPGPPAEIRFLGREGFSPPDKFTWLETSLQPGGDVVSDCLAQPEEPEHSDFAELRGVRWDTGSEESFDIHVPHQAAAKKDRGTWTIGCGPLTVARDLRPTYPQAPHEGSRDSGPLDAGYPAANVGVPLLARGPFIFDLPHGRLWLDRASLDETVPRNLSGLTVDYVMKKRGRVLEVAGIRKGSRAAALLKQGLRPGTVISEVDSRAAEELDLWEVERRLAGVYGDTVTLEWASKSGRKIAPLKVR
jgi:hypothetical protein